MTDQSPETLRRIEAALLRLRGRLRARLALQGALVAASAALGAALVLFALDRAFTPPAPVRITLLLLCLGGLGALLWRFLLRPLRLPLGPQEMALALERFFPELAQQLISAVQLGRALPAAGNSPDLVAALLARAEGTFGTLPQSRIFDRRRLAGAAAAGIVLAVAAAGGWASAPGDVAAWVRRMAGMEVRYPRATLLSILLPESSPFFRVSGDRILAARGADLTVAVRVDGRIPEAVFLVLDDGSEHAMTPKETRLFRHTFRSVSSPFAFFARGGDDPEGDRRVSVQVAEAPAVAAIRAEIAPPAYTGGETKIQEGGPLEGLPGSAATLFVRPTQPVRRAVLVFDSGLELALAELPGGEYRAAFPLERPDRYRVTLEGQMGLSSVRPGSYPILLLKDAPPRIQMADPAGGETLLTAQGVVPLRAQCSDDFGLTRLVLRLEFPDGALAGELVLFSGPARRRLDVVRLIRPQELLPPGGRNLREGDTLQLKLVATDNAEPEPSTAPPPREHRVNLVSPAELLRAVSDQMRRQRIEVEAAVRTQKRLSLALAETGEAAGGPGPAVRSSLQAVQSAQNRLAGNTRRLARGLAAGFDLYLFGGTLDPAESDPLQARFSGHYEALDQQPDYDPRFYLALRASHRAGEIAISPRAGRVLDMIAAALELESNLLPELERLLARAQAAPAGEPSGKLIEQARGLQDQALARLEELLAWLEEWSQFDDVIQVIRDLNEAQRRLLDRTRMALPGIKDK